MKKLSTVISLLICIVISVKTNGQLNTEFVSNFRYDEELCDIWGYVAPDGTEYALVGTNDGVSIVSLADPENLEEVAFVPGQFSRWRDLKTFGQFAYVVADQPNTTEGLVIINLENLPNGVTTTNWRPLIQGQTLLTMHNLYIDERGICYLSGGNINAGGVVLINVADNPTNPSVISLAAPTYSHDVYVQDNLMYSSEIDAGLFSIYDVSDPVNPQILASQQTPFIFTHNAWTSTDGNTIYTTDERANAPVAAYDISDVNDIKLVDEFRPFATLNTGVIPHNVHVKDDFLVISYYTDGVVIVDASRPNNLIEVGNYDTSNRFTAGFHGAWGAYPFLPSGLILVTDIEEGLFVVRPNYISAAHLEGKITDATDGTAINKVAVEIETEEGNSARSNILGNYATGLANGGSYDVNFSRKFYLPTTRTVQLSNGELTTLDVVLEKEPSFVFQGDIFNELTEEGIAEASFSLQTPDTSYFSASNSSGQVQIDEVFIRTYDLFAGKWGFVTEQITNFDIASTQSASIGLTPGFYDDFFFDFGWTSTGNAASGFWERGMPNPTSFNNEVSNPGIDIPGDIGNFAFVTGNSPLGGAGTDDIDNGTVTLTSPIFNVSNFVNPELSFHIWFFNDAGDPPLDDTLKIFLANELDTILIHQQTETTGGWQALSFDLEDLIDVSQDWSLIAEAGDVGGPHLVEAGLDGFNISYTNIRQPTSTESLDVIARSINKLFPNPFQEQFSVSIFKDDSALIRQLVLYNSLGQPLQTINISNAEELISIPVDGPSGVYFIQLVKDGRVVDVRKIVKE